MMKERRDHYGTIRCHHLRASASGVWRYNRRGVSWSDGFLVDIIIITPSQPIHPRFLWSLMGFLFLTCLVCLASVYHHRSCIFSVVIAYMHISLRFAWNVCSSLSLSLSFSLTRRQFIRILNNSPTFASSRRRRNHDAAQCCIFILLGHDQAHRSIKGN